MKACLFLSLFLMTSFALADEAWTIDSQVDWEQITESQANLEIKEGMVTPTAKKASFQSKLKRFDKRKAVKSILISQSPVWENWEPIENIGTISMYDSPVFLSLGPGNYWMFARCTASRGKKLTREQGRTGPFVSQAATLEGSDIPLVTTEVPSEFKAPGGLKMNEGYENGLQSLPVNWEISSLRKKGFFAKPKEITGGLNWDIGFDRKVES